MKHPLSTLVILLHLFIFVQQGFADVYFLPKTKSDLPPDTQEDEMVHISGAKVAYFNRFALERDFPFLKGKPREEIESWILKNFAYISTAQLSLNGIRQSDIPHDPAQKETGYRPEEWNRAAVIPYKDESGAPVGLVDIKGAGFSAAAKGKIEEQIKEYQAANGDQKAIDTLRTKDHSDGLASFGEAIAEVTRAQALQKIFDEDRKKHSTNFETVEHYFIIQLPFEILKEGEKKEQAALIGRQAHYGRVTNLFRISDSFYIDPLGGKQFDLFGAAVDMGGVFPTAEEFQERFLTQAQREAFKNGDRGTRTFDPQESLEWKYAHETAAAFLRGDRDAIYGHISTMVGNSFEIAPRPRFNSLLKALAQAMTDSNLEVRRKATLGFAQTKLLDQQTLSEIVDLLEHDNPEVRRAVAYAVAKIKPTDPKIHLTLAKLLTDSDFSVSAAAAHALGEIKPADPKSHLALAQVLTDSNPYVRRAAASALEEIKPTEPAVIHTIFRGLLKDAFIRSETARLIQTLGIHLESPQLQRYVASGCSEPLDKVLNPKDLQEVMNYLNSQ